MQVADDSVLRFLVEQSPDGHFIVVEGRFVYLNPSALRMFGYDESPPVLRVLDVLHPSEHGRAEANMELRTRGELKGSAAFLALRKDGSTFPIEVHAAPIVLSGQTGLHGVIRDRTKRRTMEEKLDRMERNSLVGRLSAGIAHDFNNLLAIIQTNTELAQQDQPDGPVRDALTRIRAAVQRGSEKVRQLRQMGSHGPEEQRPLHLNALVEEVLDLTRPRWRDEAEASGITYAMRWQPGSPPPVLGSPSELRAALVALIFNAIEAMPEGGPVTVRTVQDRDGNAMVLVQDRGHGIPPVDLPRLTDAFFTTRKDRKMGMGLHLAQSVLAAHGGRLEVDSELGKGSSFAVIFPPSSDPPADPPPPPKVDFLHGRSTSVPTIPESTRPPSRGGRNILLIDDQSDLVQVVRNILEDRGFSVDVALNGRDGLAMVDATKYSVVLTDLGMPDISGLEVAHHVREVQPTTPVVLMTGWAADVDRSRLAEARIHALLAKPFRSEELLRILEDALGDTVPTQLD